MAFARVASIKTSVGATGASQLIPPPTGVMTGDLMLAFCINRVTTTAITASTGWTSISTDSSTTYSAIFGRIATGSVDDRLTIAQTSDDWCVCMMRIIDHGVTTVSSDVKIGTPAGATSTTPDPPSLSPGSTQDWLWLCMAGGQLTATTNTLTGQPANYTQACATKSASSTTSVSLGVAYRAVNGSSENPGTFTQNTSRAWRAQTISVPPGSTRTGARIDESPLAVFSNTVAVTTASFTPPANSVLVAVCAVGNSTGSGAQTLTLTDSLSSSWTRLDTYTPATGEGLLEIHALDIGAGPAARTVTLTGSGTNGKGVSLGVYCLLGVNAVASILGATLHSNATSDNGSITVGTANSLVFVADLDNTSAALPGMRANTEIDITTNDGTNGQKAAVGHVHDRQATGALTVGFTFTATAQNGLAAWELKELSTAVTGTVADTLGATTASIAGTVVNPITGTVADTLAATTAAIAGTNTVPAITGTVARTLDATTAVVAGSRTIPDFTGTVARTLDATTAVAAGSRTIPAFTGTVARTLDATTAVAAGSVGTIVAFGNPDQRGTSVGGLTGTLVATKYVLAEAGLVRGLHYYAKEDGNVKGAIFADSGATPGALIIANNTATAVFKDTWNTVDVADTILAAGTYWIAFLEDHDGMRGYKAGGTSQAAYKTAQGYAGGMPSSWTPTGYQDNDYVCFADYTPAIVGTVARTLDPTTMVAAGSRTVPDFTGTVARTLDATTAVAAGSRTVPNFTGTVARTLDATTAVAAGSRTVPNFTGTVACTLDATTAVASGSRTIPPITGTVARTLDATTAVASGTSAGSGAITGTVARTLDSTTAVASGTRTVPNFTGTVARTLDSTTAVAAGSRTIPNFTGTVARTLDSTSATIVGTRTVPAFTGTVARTLDSTTVVATGARTVPSITGTIAATLDPVTMVAVGVARAPVRAAASSAEWLGVAVTITWAGVAPFASFLETDLAFAGADAFVDFAGVANRIALEAP